MRGKENRRKAFFFSEKREEDVKIKEASTFDMTALIFIRKTTINKKVCSLSNCWVLSLQKKKIIISVLF